ncbi:MAG: hypothetical protein JXR69_05110 [Candidatus Delongbacteria bacterium]|nr:hypothetical protein [Candidatus Delongbacteria bacterium]
MIHTLIIRPSRVELVLKTFSADYNKISEKKLISKEFSFRFNREIIDTGAYYKSFFRILADVIQPYKKDIKKLQISLRSSFFQIRSTECSSDMYSDQDYINWEVDKTINDVSEHFKYGVFYEENIKMLHLFIIRKSVESYFDEILRKIISDDIDFSIGYDFITGSKENIFVSADRVINKPFNSEHSSLKMWNFPTEKIRAEVRFKRTLIATITLFILSSAFYLTYFQSENMYKLYINLFEKNNEEVESKIISPELTKMDTPVVSDSIENEDTVQKTSEAKFLDKLFEDEPVIKNTQIRSLNLYDILDSLVAYDPASIIFQDHRTIVAFRSTKSLNKFKDILNLNDAEIVSSDVKNNILNFHYLKNKVDYSISTKIDFLNLSKTLKVNSKNPYIVLNTKDVFYKMTDLLSDKGQMFNKFVLSNRGNKLYLAVYFD